MSPEGPRPHPGFETPETFENRVEFHQLFRRMIPLLVMLFLLSTLILALILHSWVLALLLSAGFNYVLYLLKKRQFEATWSMSTLKLSPDGVVSADPHVRTELPWPRIHQIGNSDLMAPLRVRLHPLVKVALAAGTASVRRSDDALIGAGTLTLSPNASAAVRAQVAQNDRGREVEFRRFGGHLMAERFARSGRMSSHAKGFAVFQGVQA